MRRVLWMRTEKEELGMVRRRSMKGQKCVDERCGEAERHRASLCVCIASRPVLEAVVGIERLVE